MILWAIGHRMFGAIIVVSEQQRASLINDCNIPSEKVYFHHCWVDDVLFSLADNTLPKDRDGMLIVACGAENRNYSMLSEAATRLDMKFEIYGHDYFGTNLGSKDTHTSPNFERMPRVSFPDLVQAYRRANAVAVPLNKVDYAAGVTGLIEAMSCAKPVIVTKTPGLEDYLDAIEPTLRLRPGDVDHAVDVFKAFAQRREAVNVASGIKNREWVRQNCALDKYTAFVQNLMQ